MNSPAALSNEGLLGEIQASKFVAAEYSNAVAETIRKPRNRRQPIYFKQIETLKYLLNTPQTFSVLTKLLFSR